MVHPVVHPVPDPTAQAGFSSVPLCTPGHKDKTHTPSSTDSEKTQEICSLHPDSSAPNSETFAALSLPCFGTQKSSSPLSDAGCEHEQSGSSGLEQNYENMCESSQNDVENEQEKVHKTVTVDDSNTSENNHTKVTVIVHVDGLHEDRLVVGTAYLTKYKCNAAWALNLLQSNPFLFLHEFPLLY